MRYVVTESTLGGRYFGTMEAADIESLMERLVDYLVEHGQIDPEYNTYHWDIDDHGFPAVFVDDLPEYVVQEENEL